MYVPTASISSIKKQYGNQLKSTQWLYMEFIDFNLVKPPFKDNVKLREALSLVINRNDIVNHVTREGDTPLYSFFPSSIENGIYKDLSYNWRNWPMDKKAALAKKLYKESGYSSSNPLRISIQYNTDEVHKKVMEAVAQILDKSLGVQSSIANSEFKVFKGKTGTYSHSKIFPYSLINSSKSLYSPYIIFFFIIAKSCSMGLKSGEYGGKNNAL